ncbi:hypothetical protein CERSUDRAFT_100286 [Gelatoporia subvermispora B]|uniref:DUF6533 domain-containing protein n=1 Tax=Ceriporiopsis subvermispora (strain B) TaxID=914234 RepID=M2QYK1_CERS8|nr:hypothetical protein CERSUDRAFT_100286 [Gelatoporia subvermispora B]
MSMIYGPVASQIASLVSSSVIDNYCTFASAALVLYDHICTISQEMQLIWGSNVTSTMVLFHANRWLILAYAILNLAQMSPQSCAVLNYAGDALDLCLFVLWAAFSGIRVYALSGGSRLLSLGVTLLSLVPVVAISTELCKVAADTIVLFITWLKTWSTIRMAREHNVKTPLMTMLLRDGTLYFLGLLSLNVLNLAGQVTNVFTRASAFSTPLSAIIITHFLINLRQLADVSANVISDPSFVREGAPNVIQSQTSSLRFGSFVGNMGESLVHGSKHDNRDEVWDEDVQDAAGHLSVNTQIIQESPNASVASARSPFYDEVMEDEMRLDQAADVGPLV